MMDIIINKKVVHSVDVHELEKLIKEVYEIDYRIVDFENWYTNEDCILYNIKPRPLPSWVYEEMDYLNKEGCIEDPFLWELVMDMLWNEDLPINIKELHVYCDL